MGQILHPMIFLKAVDSGKKKEKDTSGLSSHTEG